MPDSAIEPGYPACVYGGRSANTANKQRTVLNVYVNGMLPM